MCAREDAGLVRSQPHRFLAEGPQRHRYERNRHLLAGREQHVQLARVRVWGHGKGEVDQFVRRVPHRGDHDDHLVPGSDTLDHAARNVTNAVGIGDGGSAVLLDYEHGYRVGEAQPTSIPRGL